MTFDGAFGSPIDVGPVVPDPVDEDVVGYMLVDVGPAVDSGWPMDVEVDPHTLMRRFPVSGDMGDAPEPLERFAPIRAPFTDIDAHRHVNDPGMLDIDAACFMMLTLDLPSLFGIIARPANMLIGVRDDPQFDDWLHVISDPVVVRVFAGEDEAEVRSFRDHVVELLRRAYGLTLTASHYLPFVVMQPDERAYIYFGGGSARFWSSILHGVFLRYEVGPRHC